MSDGGEVKPPKTTAREVTAFTRQLTSLLNAGLALVQALDLIAHTARRDAMAHVARALARRIASGERFAQAQRRNFGGLCINDANRGSHIGCSSAVDHYSGSFRWIVVRIASTGLHPNIRVRRFLIRPMLRFPRVLAIILDAGARHMRQQREQNLVAIER